MFMYKEYNKLAEEYKELLAKYNANKIEHDVTITELEEKKQNEKRFLRYTNQLKKENDDITGKYNKMGDDCYDLLKWNEASDKLIKELRKIVDESKKAVFAIKELLGKAHSDWRLGPEMAWRFNKETGKMERYDIPKKFDEWDAEKLYFDDDFTMCTFKYPNNNGYLVDYKIPISLYTRIGGKAFINQTGRTFFYDFGLFKNRIDLKSYIISKGGSLNGKYWNKVLSFILDHQEIRFSTKEFLDYCKFANRESCRQHLNKLIKWEIIQKVSMGLFESVSL